MSDYNSSLPIRTQNNGDVVTFIADGTTPSQLIAVDTHGSLSTIIKDASGNAATTQTNGVQRALDVGIDVAGVQIDPRSIRTLTTSDIITANQGAPNTTANAWPISVTINGSINAPTNPLFVSFSDVAGNSINNYQTSAAVASAATVNLDYTVSASKTFYTKQFWASASGKLKIQIEYETAAGSGIFNTFWVGFNSTAETNILIPSSKTQVTGARIRMALTNLDKAAMDIYSTLSGTEQ